MSKRILIPIAVLAVAASACGGTITLPQAPTAGPLIVDKVSVPAPDEGPARLTISYGAGELKLAPGASGLVEGTASYNFDALKPEIITDGANVEIKQEDLLTLVEPTGVKTLWDFQLGAAPMELTVNAGAYEGDFELGGLSLTGLTVKDGASSVTLAFSEPNLAEMAVLRYETGASQVEMTGLGNANFSTMLFNSGAGDYTLDFSGDLKRDATITVSTGLSNLNLVIPDDVSANVTVETGLSNIDAGPSWSQDGNRYSHAGSGPMLTFIVKGGVGNLTLSE